MKLAPSAIADVELRGAHAEDFEADLAAVLEPALPFSVIVENRATRWIALLGVRFDMLSPHAKRYSVVHYSDTLRNPGQGDFGPGTRRFICAEPEYTALALKGGAGVRLRGKMNLDNLRRMLSSTASLDCVAFDDGQFFGPDSQKAFDRLNNEREVEKSLIEEALSRVAEPVAALEDWLGALPNGRPVVHKLLKGLEAGGPAEMAARAREHRYRIALWH
jgi:hypothetical protein